MQVIRSWRGVPVKQAEDLYDRDGIEYQMSMLDFAQQNGHAERFQQTIINGIE